MHARGAQHEAVADELGHAALRSIKYVTVGVDVTGGLRLTNMEGVSGERESAAGCSWLSRCAVEPCNRPEFAAARQTKRFCTSATAPALC
jgi:hypothetical protein